MDTNRIRYFLSLAKVGSVSGAAELHHISPAAFSKAMKVFESEVGHVLTLPHGRGLVLTDYAKSLVPRLENIIKQIDSVHEGLEQNISDQKKLRVATFEVFSTYFLARAMSAVFPEYQCEVYELIPGRMEEAVANGKADLALSYNPIPHPNLDFLKICEIEMGIFAHPRLLKKHSYETLPFAIPISPIEGAPTKVQGLDGWPDQSFPREVHFKVQLLETALGLAREGLAAAYLPKFIARLHNEIMKPSLHLELLEIPKGFLKKKDWVYLIKRKTDEEGSTAKKMAQAIRKICN